MNLIGNAVNSQLPEVVRRDKSRPKFRTCIPLNQFPVRVICLVDKDRKTDKESEAQDIFLKFTIQYVISFARLIWYSSMFREYVARSITLVLTSYRVGEARE